MTLKDSKFDDVAMSVAQQVVLLLLMTAKTNTTVSTMTEHPVVHG